jgi:hypothetical protein
MSVFTGVLASVISELENNIMSNLLDTIETCLLFFVPIPEARLGRILSLACIRELALQKGNPPSEPLGLLVSRGQRNDTLHLHFDTVSRAYLSARVVWASASWTITVTLSHAAAAS